MVKAPMGPMVTAPLKGIIGMVVKDPYHQGDDHPLVKPK